MAHSTYTSYIPTDLYKLFGFYLRDYERDWLTHTRPSPRPILIKYGELHLFDNPLVNTYIAGYADAISAVESGSIDMVEYLGNQFINDDRFDTIACRVIGRTGYIHLLPAIRNARFMEYIEEGLCGQVHYDRSVVRVNRVAEVILGKRIITDWSNIVLHDVIPSDLSTLKIFRKYLGPYPKKVSLVGADEYIRYVYLDADGLLASPTVAVFDIIVENVSPQLAQDMRDKFRY